MRTIAIVNQKGGCGKTTTAINLAALYAKRGLRTLLVDMDPQSHCAAGLGVPESRIEYSIGDALLASHTPRFDASTLVWEVARNLHLAPSTVMLSAMEAPGGGLHSLPDKDRRLESLLACIGSQYDRCLIDCPPTIGLLTFNALRAARETLIPVETGFFSLRGAEKQWNTIQRMISHIGRPIACHLLPTLHNPQSQLACNILAALRRQFAGQIMPIVIHEDEALREAASFGQPVLEYAPESQARHDFESLADWLEEHAARPSAQIEILAQQHDMGNLRSDTANGHLDHDSSGERNGTTAGSRAAELARRMHTLGARSSTEAAPQSTDAESAASTVATETSVAVAEMETAERPTNPQSALEIHQPNLAHVYGVRQVSRGILFVQPPTAARQSLAIAGEFNHWSPTAHPLRFNDHAGVFEAIVSLPAGAYQYRLVADGEWIADPHNPNQQVNSYGEPNSLLVVK